jgi:exonuclease III
MIKNMKLLSLNLRYGGQSRTDSILNYINNQQPDILVLGEYKDDVNGQKMKTTLQEEGFYFEESGDKVLGVLVASKHPFTTIDKNPRWVEIELKDNDLKVLGVYVPTGSGDKEFKDSFWLKILNYARENQDKNCIITGDFNSCGKEDTMNLTYSEKELKELLSLNWIDSWASYKNDDSERYTWFSNAGNGFRLDYIFLSPKLMERSTWSISFTTLK